MVVSQPCVGSRAGIFLGFRSSQWFPLLYGSSITSHGSLRPVPYPHPILRVLAPFAISSSTIAATLAPNTHHGTYITPQTHLQAQLNLLLQPYLPSSSVLRPCRQSCGWKLRLARLFMVGQSGSSLSSSIRYASYGRRGGIQKSNLHATFHALLPPSLPLSEPSLRLPSVKFAKHLVSAPSFIPTSVPHSVHWIFHPALLLPGKIALTLPPAASCSCTSNDRIASASALQSHGPAPLQNSRSASAARSLLFPSLRLFRDNAHPKWLMDRTHLSILMQLVSVASPTVSSFAKIRYQPTDVCFLCPHPPGAFTPTHTNPTSSESNQSALAFHAGNPPCHAVSPHSLAPTPPIVRPATAVSSLHSAVPQPVARNRTEDQPYRSEPSSLHILP